MLERKVQEFFGRYGLEKRIGGLESFLREWKVHFGSLEENIKMEVGAGLSACWGKFRGLERVNSWEGCLTKFYLSCLALRYQSEGRWKDSWRSRKAQTAVRIWEMISKEEKTTFWEKVISDYAQEWNEWKEISWGHFFFRQKRYEEALAHFIEGRNEGGDCPELFYSIGKCYQELRQPKLALDFYKETKIRMVNEAPDLLYNMGDCYYGIRDYNAALECFRKAEGIWNHGGPVERTHGLYSSIGKCLTKRGKFGEAISYFKKAREYLPGNLSTGRDLMINYSNLGEEKAALNELEFCLKNNDDPERIRKALKECALPVKEKLEERWGYHLKKVPQSL